MRLSRKNPGQTKNNSHYFTFISAIKTHSPEKPVLIFVSSRRQTRLTALDLIAFLAGEDNPKQWLHMAENEVGAGSTSIFQLL